MSEYMERNSKFKIIDTYFPNGNKYTTHVFEEGVILRLKKYFLSGELESICEYENGNITNKKIFGKNNRICEYFNYQYDEDNDLCKITKDEEYFSSEVTFKRNESSEITEITIKINDTLSRKLIFTYTEDGILCNEISGMTQRDYKLYTPPKADDKWLLSKTPQSLVMRKLRVAQRLSA